MEMPVPETVLGRVKELGWTHVRLSFSAGKDSIVAMHCLLKGGFKVEPIYFAPYPGLPMMDKLIKQYEDFFETKILTLPHPWVFNRNSNLIYQTPFQVRLIEQLNLHEHPTFEDILDATEEGHAALKLPAAICIKMCDSQNRFRTIWRKTTINKEAKQFYPVGCVSNKWIWAYILENKIPMPRFYKSFGESFDLPRPDMMVWMKQNEPESYEHIIRHEPNREIIQKARRQVGA